jgi:hypothetical protein
MGKTMIVVVRKQEVMLEHAYHDLVMLLSIVKLEVIKPNLA